MTHLILKIDFLVPSEGSILDTHTSYLLPTDWYINNGIFSNASFTKRILMRKITSTATVPRLTAKFSKENFPQDSSNRMCQIYSLHIRRAVKRLHLPRPVVIKSEHYHHPYLAPWQPSWLWRGMREVWACRTWNLSVVCLTIKPRAPFSPPNDKIQRCPVTMVTWKS